MTRPHRYLLLCLAHETHLLDDRRPLAPARYPSPERTPLCPALSSPYVTSPIAPVAHAAPTALVSRRLANAIAPPSPSHPPMPMNLRYPACPRNPPCPRFLSEKPLNLRHHPNLRHTPLLPSVSPIISPTGSLSPVVRWFVSVVPVASYSAPSSASMVALDANSA